MWCSGLRVDAMKPLFLEGTAKLERQGQMSDECRKGYHGDLSAAALTPPVDWRGKGAFRPPQSLGCPPAMRNQADHSQTTEHHGPGIRFRYRRNLNAAATTRNIEWICDTGLQITAAFHIRTTLW